MPTPFQKRVYAALKQVPHGRVITYKQLAECLGCRSCRAVGQALKRNPYAPTVPCHRVIASDLTPGGFMGRREGAALRRKLDLLAKEGVGFHAGKLAELKRLFRFQSKRPTPNFERPTPNEKTRTNAEPTSNLLSFDVGS